MFKLTPIDIAFYLAVAAFVALLEEPATRALLTKRGFLA